VEFVGAAARNYLPPLSRPALFLILVMACFLLGGPAHRAAQPSTILSCLASGWPLIVAIMLGLQGVIYTVDGWDGVITSAKRYAYRAATSARHFGSVFSIMGDLLVADLVGFTSCP